MGNCSPGKSTPLTDYWSVSSDLWKRMKTARKRHFPTWHHKCHSSNPGTAKKWHTHTHTPVVFEEICLLTRSDHLLNRSDRLPRVGFPTCLEIFTAFTFPSVLKPTTCCWHLEWHPRCVVSTQCGVAQKSSAWRWWMQESSPSVSQLLPFGWFFSWSLYGFLPRAGNIGNEPSVV